MAGGNMVSPKVPTSIPAEVTVEGGTPKGKNVIRWPRDRSTFETAIIALIWPRVFGQMTPT